MYVEMGRPALKTTINWYYEHSISMNKKEKIYLELVIYVQEKDTGLIYVKGKDTGSGWGGKQTWFRRPPLSGAR